MLTCHSKIKQCFKNAVPLIQKEKRAKPAGHLTTMPSLSPPPLQIKRLLLPHDFLFHLFFLRIYYLLGLSPSGLSQSFSLHA